MDLSVTHILLIAYFEGFFWRAVENWAPGVLVLALLSLPPFRRETATRQAAYLFVAGYTFGLALATPPIGFLPYDLILPGGSLLLFLLLLAKGWERPKSGADTAD